MLRGLYRYIILLTFVYSDMSDVYEYIIVFYSNR